MLQEVILNNVPSFSKALQFRNHYSYPRNSGGYKNKSLPYFSSKPDSTTISGLSFSVA